MAKTYVQLAQEIETLKTQAEVVRRQEKAGVVARIREAIAIYSLTAEELGFGKRAGPSNAGVSSSDSKAAAVSTNATVRYRDDAGHTWSGRGPRPKWLKAGLASGLSLESFASSEPAPRKAKKKFKSIVKYRDGAGHQWTGFGPKPGWLTAALESGTTLEQLAA